jgi:hypothetical protein
LQEWRRWYSHPGAPVVKAQEKQIQFSTLRFFQQQDEQLPARKLRNWLLLALRLLIVSLLVLAFSRPYLRQGQASAANRKQHRVVFVPIVRQHAGHWNRRPAMDVGQGAHAEGPF